MNIETKGLILAICYAAIAFLGGEAPAAETTTEAPSTGAKRGPKPKAEAAPALKLEDVTARAQAVMKGDAGPKEKLKAFITKIGKKLSESAGDQETLKKYNDFLDGLLNGAAPAATNDDDLL